MKAHTVGFRTKKEIAADLERAVKALKFALEAITTDNEDQKKLALTEVLETLKQHDKA